MNRPVRAIVYSDDLRPWCYPAAVRLRRLADELWPSLALEHRASPLRPVSDPSVSFTGPYREGAWRRCVFDSWPHTHHDPHWRPPALEAAPCVGSIPAVIFPDSGRVLVGLAGLAPYRACIQEAARC